MTEQEKIALQEKAKNHLIPLSKQDQRRLKAINGDSLSELIDSQDTIDYQSQTSEAQDESENRIYNEVLFEQAENNDAAAQFELFLCYNNGTYGIPNDKEEANKYLHKAAENGYAEAQYMLSLDYYEGYEECGSQIDEATANRYLRESANNGHADAQDKLGYCYMYGECGFQKDKLKALMYWQVAAKDCDYSAQDDLKGELENVLKNLEASTKNEDIFILNAFNEWIEKGCEFPIDL